MLICNQSTVYWVPNMVWIIVAAPGRDKTQSLILSTLLIHWEDGKYTYVNIKDNKGLKAYNAYNAKGQMIYYRKTGES